MRATEGSGTRNLDSLKSLTFSRKWLHSIAILLSYSRVKGTARKPVFFMTDEIRTPPMSENARREAGFLVGRLQEGATLGMPQARPMPDVGRRCLELRVTEDNKTWRILCRVDPDAVLVIHSFAKKTQETPKSVIELCKRRLALYDATK